MSHPLFAVLFLTLTGLACGPASQASLTLTETNANNHAVVQGFHILKDAITLQLASEDCDKEQAFDVSWLESDPAQLLVTRVQRGTCGGKRGFQELSVHASEEFYSLTNKVPLEKKSYRCAAKKPEKVSRFLADKGGCCDLPHPQEDVVVQFTVGGCTEGNLFTLFAGNAPHTSLINKHKNNFTMEKICSSGIGSTDSLYSANGTLAAVQVTHVAGGLVQAVSIAHRSRDGLFPRHGELPCEAL